MRPGLIFLIGQLAALPVRRDPLIGAVWLSSEHERDNYV